MTENHMVIDINKDLDPDAQKERERSRREFEAVAEAMNMLLQGKHLFCDTRNRVVTFEDDVSVRVFEHDEDKFNPDVASFVDCLKDVIENYPCSKMATLIRYAASKVAQDVLDIDLER